MESRRARPVSKPAGQIAATKLVPPRAARQLVVREALLARLTEARWLRCVLLRSPVGSGKTSTLVAWRQELMSLDFDVAWLSAAAEDDEASRFFDCLLASIAQVEPAIVGDASLLAGRALDEPAIEYLVIALVRGIAAHRRELVLMVDDLQYLDDPGVTLALQRLLDYAPANLHLVFASRSAPRFSLARLRSQQLAAEFNLRDLLFSEAESESFLRQRLGVIDPRDAAQLHRLTEGWVAGLQLFAVDLKVRKTTHYPQVPLRDARSFAQFIEREVLVRLSGQDLDLLTRMAVCNRFCAQLCATLIGTPRAVAQMMSRLSELERNDLFLTQIPTGEREIWYRLHPLLREALMIRLDGLPDADRRALHALAWRWFEDHGHVDEAVRHAVLSGETSAAADLVESIADSMMERGEYNQAAALIRQLPQAELQGRRLALRLSLARLQLYRGEVDRLSESITGLRREFDTSAVAPDRRHRFELLYLRGALAAQREDRAEIEACLPLLRGAPDDIGAMQKAGMANVMAWMHLCRGEFADARQVLAGASALERSPQLGMVADCLVGLSHVQQGHMAAAEQCLDQVLERSGIQGSAFSVATHMAACLLADVLYERNALGRLRESLQGHIDVVERISFPHAALFALLALGRAERLAGHRVQAWACIDRLEDYAGRRGLERLTAHALGTRVQWHLLDGEPGLAAKSLARLQQIGGRHAGARWGGSGEILLLASRARIAWLVHEREHRRAVAELRRLRSACEAAGRHRDAVGLGLMLSSLLLEDGGAAPAREASRQELLRALVSGHRLGLVRTVLDASERMAERLNGLAAERTLDPIVDFYLKRLLQAAEPAPDAGEPRAAVARGQVIDSLSERETDVLMLVSQSMANKRIARILNVSAETVKWHLRNIYVKLGVSSRDEAVARMRNANLDRRRHG
ncbi:MAG TPA: LuxR C-terminal-related transcriptional regulator [Burkholderiaceae bacterium]|nr:LuxR C-terminal-related transcriptional regulator [Burkholderiaceae bacterium]